MMMVGVTMPEKPVEGAEKWEMLEAMVEVDYEYEVVEEVDYEWHSNETKVVVEVPGL